jgi:hypothetical protein
MFTWTVWGSGTKCTVSVTEVPGGPPSILVSSVPDTSTTKAACRAFLFH